MKARTLWTVLVTVGILAELGWAGNRNQNQAPTVVPPATTQLTADETANILRMREEEKLARDVYQVFAEMWKVPVFTNIAAAEQRHMNAVGLLITRYGLTDPVTDDTTGIFTLPEFTTLYETLTQSGANSMLDAFKAGVQIEEKDIADLETALTQTDKADIQWVFENLQAASSNHLRAFTRNVETGGAGCPLRGVSGGTGNGKGAANDVCPCCGRGGNGKCYRNGHGNQGGACQGSGLRMRDGSCLMSTPAQP